MESLMDDTDLYLEHQFHTKFYEDKCSTCYSEKQKEKNTCISCGRFSDGYSSCDACMKKAEETDIGI